MEPIAFDDIPDEVFLEDIYELTESIKNDFPAWLKVIVEQLGGNANTIRFTDFVENTDDEASPIEFAGYFYDISTRKMYQYTVIDSQFAFKLVDLSSLTEQDTFSLKVLHLLQ
ncbi:hypothetical protein [Capnocytophaga catalasegens]|uniref:Uncharacterized protein n=1 Tax=Capnocytophaga catalasegens TaxID=1004260 RepID=A0AAV5AYI2_9FLAO|nr:hypothetical protein [Capnocytophaga catalasegens]GIZ15825.1 hypothetical protein RCZ03_18250 [Capnocytophaga catalasegens]GJM49837.1 hypothetical protein RCZ15_08120 [Capnocytophaga catalasegens]GJM53002.1 hypothetical protein RCZ16_13190 [Capnocytophaga catalasegens]